MDVSGHLPFLASPQFGVAHDTAATRLMRGLPFLPALRRPALLRLVHGRLVPGRSRS
ncbi:hypothetical protein [Streptomyces sp. WMMC940]|uniref:hypothetical protein n=1 Tax=Streptomyces sp. WMMC940 TaxID=3015153 RepID=UPI0022B60ED8|nr:hypothetical protein [Streptomyces sp. WMMC940]MCZ7462258.1 hypothetical protein [Streptomyces sp. WMMC940]